MSARKNWATELERDLPDSRLKGTSRDNDTIVWNHHKSSTSLWERVYCANCGKLDGLVSADWAAHVFCLCWGCAFKHGKLNLPEIPSDKAKSI